MTKESSPPRNSTMLYRYGIAKEGALSSLAMSFAIEREKHSKIGRAAFCCSKVTCKER